MANLFENISLSYEDIKVFERFTLEIPDKKIICIVGPSGCGKSSLLNMVAGLIEPDDGRLIIEKGKIGYIFQEDRLLPWETVYNNVRIVRKDHDHEELIRILKALGLHEFRDKYPEQLSGGMKQRASIARGFYYESALLLMDEPFKSLDYDLRFSLVKYLINLWEMKQNTIIFVTHDIDEALLLGHQIIVLSKRPSSIIGIHNIHTKHKERRLDNNELINLRSTIINQIT